MSEIAEIKRRDRQSRKDWGRHWADDQERVDRATLLDEVERLRAEVERMREALEGKP